MVVVRDDAAGAGSGGIMNGGLSALLSSVSTTVDTWMREYSSPSGMPGAGDGEENMHPNTIGSGARAVGKSGRGFGAVYVPVTPGAAKRAEEEREQEEEAERERLEAGLDVVPCVRLTRFQGGVPWLDFGEVPLGGGEGGRGKTRRFRVENMEACAATLEVERAPRAQHGFGVAVLGSADGATEGAVGASWPSEGIVVGGEDDCLVCVTWVPTQAGPVRETLQLRWGSVGRVQIVLHGTAVDLGPGGARARRTDGIKSKEGKKSNPATRSRLGPVRPEFLGERVMHSATESTPTQTPSRAPLREVISSAETSREGGTGGTRPTRVRATAKRKALGTRLDLSRVTAAGAKKGSDAVLKAAPSGRLSTASADTSTTSKHAHLARWMEKQEAALTEWLNHTLLGDGNEGDDETEDKGSSSSDHGDESTFTSSFSHAKNSSSGSGRRRSSFSYAKFASAGALLSLKKRVSDLFNRDGDFRAMVTRVEEGVDAGRLQVREDSTSLLGDANLRKRATRTLVHGYSSFWLRVGLEVILGERVPTLDELAPRPGRHSEADALSEFVQSRLFASSAVEHEYRTCSSVKGLHRQGYDRALGKVVLKRLLLLVKVLDTAVACDFLGGGTSIRPSCAPLLFRRMASVKSSESMLVSLLGSNTLLRGEGDILRHLGFLGYKLHVLQSSAHEYDYAVRNLAVDLRDGVRLSRLYALLSIKESDAQRMRFLEGVRVPAAERSDRSYNLSRVFAKLKKSGMALDAGDGDSPSRLGPSSSEGALICVDDVLDGHRERTFGLLWRIMINWQLPRLLDRVVLEREIARVKKGKSRRAIAAENEDAENDLLCVYIANDDIGLLMEWAQAVCRHFGMRVQNFTSAWQDGRAFCYLIAYYHRTLLNVSEVYAPMGDAAVRATIAKRLDGESGRSGVGNISGFSTSYDMTRREDLLGSDVAGVAANFALLNRKLDALGGVPPLVRPADGILRGAKDNELDEKVVIAFVSFLCARLLATSTEVRAARCIQLHWRMRIDKMRVSSLEAAARVIQHALRGFLARSTERRHHEILERASIKMAEQFRRREDSVRASTAADSSRRERAAVLIQAWLRGSAALNRFKKMKRAAICIQAASLRRMLKRQQSMDDVVSKLLSTGLVQRQILIERRKEANERRLKQEELLASLLDKCLERRTARQENVQRSKLRAQEQVLAATKICDAWKLYIIRKRVEEIRSQARWSEKLDLETQGAAACIIQACWRAHSVRSRLLYLNSSVRTIQRAWRAYLNALEARGLQEELDAEIRREACLTIQATYKMCASRRRLGAMKKAAVTIQAHYKGYQTRSLLAAIAQQDEATKFIQSAYRTQRIRSDFLALRLATRRCQAAWRAIQSRRHFAKMRSASLTIQAAFTRYLSRKIRREESRRELSVLAACITIQSAWRARGVRSRYLATRGAISLIQSLFRGHIVRRRLRAEARERAEQLHLARTDSAATKIQAISRGFLGRLRHRALVLQRHQAACRIQSLFRMHSTRRELAMRQRSAVTIQRAFLGHMISRRMEAVRLAERTRAALMASRHAAASLIQTAYLKHAISVQMRIERNRVAARTIQASFRRHVARTTFKTARKAAIIIQRSERQRADRRDARLVRLYIRQEQERAVQIIQGAFRRFRTGAVRRHAAITIQRCARGWLGRRRSAKMTETVIYLQRRWRLHSTWELFRRQRKSTICIQAAIRGYLASRSYDRLRKATITIQKQIRVLRSRRESHRSLHLAAVAIQKSLRGWINRRNFLRMREFTLRLQRRWRLHNTWNLFCSQRKNTIRIQSWVRMHLTRKRYLPELQSSREAQRAARTLELERLEARRAYGAEKIQQAFRGRILAKSFQAKRCAAVVVQRAFLCRLVRRRAAQGAREAVERKLTAAKYIQAAFRAQLARNEHKARRELAARVIQRRFIQHLIELHVVAHARRLKACFVVQGAWRGLVQRRAYRALRLCIIRAQALWRMQRARSAYRSLKRATHVLQLRVRDKQEHLRRLAEALAKREQDVFAARIIQTAWRHVRTARSRAVHAPAVQAMPPCADRLNTGEELRVPPKCTDFSAETAKAIAALASNKATIRSADSSLNGSVGDGVFVLPSALRACTTLAETARASLECAREVVDGGVVPIMMQFIRGCDRTPGQVRLLELALSILRSLCAHEVLRESIFCAHGEVVDILAEQLQMYRDMDTVFLKALSVLERLSTTDRTRARKILGMANLVKRMDMIARLLDAKEVMQRKYCARLDLVASTTPHLLSRATRSWKSVATQAKRMHTLIAGIHRAAQ